MWEVEFYETENGKCPAQEFLDQLSKSTDLPRVINDLERLEEFGNLLHRPQADYLERNIYELRTETPSGQIRLLYFFFYQEKIIISHGLRKKQKVPSKEIDRAVANRTDYFTRHERLATPQKQLRQKKGPNRARRK